MRKTAVAAAQFVVGASFTAELAYYITATTERKPSIRPYVVFLALMVIGALVWWLNQERPVSSASRPARRAPFLLLISSLLAGALISLIVANMDIASRNGEISSLQRSVKIKLVQEKVLQAKIAYECKHRKSEGLPNLPACASPTDREQNFQTGLAELAELPRSDRLQRQGRPAS
jgi:hypothetical protein